MITTVCMNPSFDKTATVQTILPGQVNRLEDIRYAIGGKGLNVAIALSRLGKEVDCVGILGVDDKEAFHAMLSREKLDFRCVSVPGKIRTNLKVVDLLSNVVTEFNEPGFWVHKKQQEAFITLLMEASSQSTYVVFSGSLPKGCPESTYQTCMQRLQGKQYILDATGETLLLGIKEKPFLIKPNLHELEALMHKELRTLRAIADAAKFLLGYGAQNVIVSLGKFGALLINSEKVIYSPALSVEAKSSVGAGDAMLAGVLSGLAEGKGLQEAFRYGIAAGAASVMTEGDEPLNPSDFQRLLSKVTQQEV